MSEIFTPYKLGPIELRNRTIRSAAFEGMGRNNGPTEELFNYHRAVAKGGIGMTTVAYAAVCRSGISFDSQLWMREEIVPELKKLTDAVHAEGAKASIQLGHCGNMTHRRTCGQMPIGASSGFNLYSPTFHRKMNQKDIDEVVKAYGDAVRLAMKAGFDAVEIHAGHGYLIAQFLSPYTNHRHDRYGGSLDNRMNFMRECIREVVKAADGKIAVTAKLNTRDGFRGGQEVDEYIGSWAVCPTVTFKHLFFMEDALKFKAAMPDYPFIYVGGVTTGEDARKVLENGFPLFQMGRAVLEDTDFVNKLKADENHCSGCEHSNFCIGRMYSKSMQCHKHCEDITPFLEREVQRINRRNDRRERKAGYKA